MREPISINFLRIIRKIFSNYVSICNSNEYIENNIDDYKLLRKKVEEKWRKEETEAKIERKRVFLVDED